jgi:hypothetical protein
MNTLSKIAALLLAALLGSCSTGMAATTEIGSRCSDRPVEGARLSNDFSGLIRRDVHGNPAGSVWHRSGLDIKPVGLYREGNIVRLVFSDPYAKRGNSCPAPLSMEAYVAIPQGPTDTTYRLQPEILVTTETLSPRGTVQVSSAFDCGGPIAIEASEAEKANRLLDSTAVDDQTLKVTVYARHNGAISIEPRYALNGNRLEVGYVERAQSGDVAACIFHKRISFLLTGVPARDLSVTLVTRNYLHYYATLIAGGLGLVWLGVRIRAGVKRRKKATD